MYGELITPDDNNIQDTMFTVARSATEELVQTFPHITSLGVKLDARPLIFPWTMGVDYI